jgi:hypothetical protein
VLEKDTQKDINVFYFDENQTTLAKNDSIDLKAGVLCKNNHFPILSLEL